MADEEYLGELPSSPPMGVFTYRQGLPGGGGGGSYTPPNPPPGSYVPPNTGNVSNVGYEVLVKAGPDYTDAIALITQHQGLMLSREISADGAGSISLNRDAPLFYTDAKNPTNLLPNPDFEKVDSNPQSPTYNSFTWGWMVNSRSVPITWGRSAGFLTGSSVVVVTPGTGNPRINTLEGKQGILVIPGTRMTVMAQAKPSTLGRPTRLYVEFYDADGVYMWTSPSILGDPVQTEPNVINYLRVDGTVPPGAVYASVGVEVVAPGFVGEQHHFDNFQFYVTPEALPFFDGRDKSDILDKENLWEIRYDGLLIHEFLGQVRSSDLVNPSESRSVTISGPGTAVLLKRALVLPPTWVIRNGQPWLVPPIKMFKDEFKYPGGGVNPQMWNKGISMHVRTEYDDVNFTNPHNRLTLAYQQPATQPRISTGPWNLKYGAQIPGDFTGVENALYFTAYPYILPTTEDIEPAEFHNVYEIYINDLNRAYIQIFSKIGNTGLKSNTMFAKIMVDGSLYSMGAELNYAYSAHRWLRFRHRVDNRLSLEYGPDGINWTVLGDYSLAGSGDINPMAMWQDNIEQVTFRFYCYGNGMIHAYAPWENRAALTQGYQPGTLKPELITTLQPVSGPSPSNPEFPLNPAYSQISQINDNDQPDHSPVYDQMGYFKVRMENAQAPESQGGRNALPGITTYKLPDNSWTVGSFKKGAEVPGYDSIGNKRKGQTQTYFQVGGVQVNPAYVTGPDASGKYTYKDPSNSSEEPKTAILDVIGLTEPTPGQDFYEYFIQSCGIAHCDWSMRPGRDLQIYDYEPDTSYPGTAARTRDFNDRSEVKSSLGQEPVFFHEGYSTLSKQTVKSTEQIVNYVVGHDSKGNYVVAKSEESIAKWGLREEWVDVDYSDPTTLSLQTVVTATLALGVVEIESWQIQLPVMDELRPFVDYKEGDWISVARHVGADPTSDERQYDKFRVMAISLSIGVNGEETVELTLSSLLETRNKQIQKKLDNANPTAQIAAPITPPASSYLTVTNMSLDTIGNVAAPEPITGSYLRAGAGGVWVAEPGDRMVHVESGLGDGVTTLFEIEHNLGTEAIATHVFRMDTGEEITAFYALEETENTVYPNSVQIPVSVSGVDSAGQPITLTGMADYTPEPVVEKTPEVRKEVTITILNWMRVAVQFRTPPQAGNIRVVVQKGL